ncbi:MAG: Gfo/Idh/MocA family oxidoreductase [Rikenellaceae bacterium]|nr:Gfo/Idh/MocA family oxidoreductase [Rikenellaceae bacterium]
MKKLILLILTLSGILGCRDNRLSDGIVRLPVPERAAQQEDMLGFAAEPIPVVRVGFVGIGMRAMGAVESFLNIDGVEIKAVCDLETYNLERTQNILSSYGRPPAAEYFGKVDSWKELCERDDIDLVYICTDWLTHTPIAVYAMEQGKHVAVEVPAAMTVEECWQLVDTSEKTRRHCMMLENCCYDFFELATLNMAQQGLFGEIVHTEGAYIHDLRELQNNPRLSEGSAYVPGEGAGTSPHLAGYHDRWRLKYNTEHTGNPYPTHGLGPLCQILDIHRGDKMNYLVSVSSGQFGMSRYAKYKYGDDSPEAKTDYALGDMNTTIIKTERGRTIMIQHDVTSPRPYSRIHMVSGTRGFAQKYPLTHIALEPDGHRPLSRPAMDSLLAVYEFPFVTEIKELARQVGGHGGMDFIMDYRLIYCLRYGLPLDQDVYDAAEWSSLVELTEISARCNGRPVEVPDFTRGAWNKGAGFSFAYAD